MKKSQLGVAIALCGLTGSVLAEEMSFSEQEMPVVLSATRLKQAVADAPASITIIDRQMIEQSAARELPELLRLVPGMVVGYDSGWEAFVSYHGTSADKSRRMQVLVDGRSIYQPILAYVDWLGLPLELDDIDHIEVIRGPNAAAYGANSFLAVINIITRHPADVPTARAYSRIGSDGIQDNFASVGATAGATSFQLSASSRKDHGFAYTLDRDTHEILHDFVDDKYQKAVNGKMVWETGSEGVLTIGAGRSEMRGQENVGLGDQGDIISYRETPVADLTQKYLNLNFEQGFNSHQIELQADYSQYRRSEIYKVQTYPILMKPALREMFLQDRVFVDRGFLPSLQAYQNGDITQEAMFGSDEDFEQWKTDNNKTNDDSLVKAAIIFRDGYFKNQQLNDLTNSILGDIGSDSQLATPLNYNSVIDDRESRLEAELQDTWTINPQFRVVYGSGIQTSKSDSLHYFDGKVENTVWRLFAHGEWQFIPNWRLNVGAMDEHDDSAGHFLSPRLALNWRFAPTQSLRVVTSKAYRTPDLQEEKAYWQFQATTEDRSLSQYDGNHYYLAKALTGYECVKSHSYPTYNYVVCNDKAPSEEIVSTEIGYYGELPSLHLQTDIRVYQDQLKLAEHNLEVNDFVIAPLEDHEQRGVELSSQWRPYPNWRFLLNYAYDDISGFNDNTMFVPKHSGNVAAWYDDPSGIQASMSYVFYNQLFLNISHAEQGLYYDQLAFRLAKKWSFNKRNDVELSGVWQMRLTEDPELRKENGAPRDKMWLGLSYYYD